MARVVISTEPSFSHCASTCRIFSENARNTLALKRESSQSPRRSFFSRASHRYPTNALFSAYLQIRIILKRMTYPTWHPFFYFFLLLLLFFNFYKYNISCFYKFCRSFVLLHLATCISIYLSDNHLLIRSENIFSKIFNVSDLFLKRF